MLRDENPWKRDLISFCFWWHELLKFDILWILNDENAMRHCNCGTIKLPNPPLIHNAVMPTVVSVQRATRHSWTSQPNKAQVPPYSTHSSYDILLIGYIFYLNEVAELFVIYVLDGLTAMARKVCPWKLAAAKHSSCRFNYVISIFICSHTND